MGSGETDAHSLAQTAESDTDAAVARTPGGAPGASLRRPYASPRLTIYGSLEELTKTGGRTTRDGRGGRKRH